MHKRTLSLAIIAAMILPMLMAVYVPVNVSGAPDPGQEQVSWITATLDKISQAGSSVSVAVDSEGFVHASYYSEITSTIMYVTNIGGTWTTQQVDSVSGRGLFNSIATDAEDNPWIVYYDSTNKDLLYAKMTTDGWERGVVDEEADVGRYNDISFSPFGDAAVSYYDTNEKLKFAMFDDGEFVTETVDDMNPGSTSVSFYWDARPVVTYLDKDDSFMKVATKENDTWVFQFVEETSASSVSSSVMTKDDHLAVVYRSTATGMMRFGELVSGVWSNMNLNASVSASSSISLAADDEGSYHISYYSTSDSSLVYLNDAKGWWESQVLDDTGEAGIKNAIAVNEFDRISVVYIDGITQHLKFITNDKATWKMFVVDNEGSQIGTSSDMTVDFDGNTHIVYYNGTALLYYTDQDGDYQHVLDTNAGMNPSIAVDLDGDVYVSYYDETNQYLKFAALKDGSWTTRIVDSSIGVGTHSSVAVSSSGNITIVYTDDQEQKLKYVSGKANSWTGLLYIDDSGLVDVSSEIDSVYANNALHVSYVRSQSLYHAERVANVWSEPEMIDDVSSVDGATSIASNDDGLIYISYHVNGGTKGLKLATFDDAWTTQWVVKSDSYDQGAWNSLNVDTDGQPQIAYSGPDGESLMFAAWHGSLWLMSEVFTLPVEGKVSSAVDRVGSVHIAYYDDDESVFRFISQITSPGEATMSLVIAGDSILIGIGAPEMNGGADVESYVVYRGTSADNLVPIATLMASITSFNDTDVDSDTTYYYAIKAINSEGAGELSSIQGITTEAGDETNDLDLTLLVIVAVIVVAVIAVAFIFLNRRKR